MMMIMEGSKMFKTEYDLKAILYSVHDTSFYDETLIRPSIRHRQTSNISRA